MIINSLPYNIILGRPQIGNIDAITSATHKKIPDPIPGGNVGQIDSDHAMARRCLAQMLKESK